VGPFGDTHKGWGDPPIIIVECVCGQGITAQSSTVIEISFWSVALFYVWRGEVGSMGCFVSGLTDGFVFWVAWLKNSAAFSCRVTDTLEDD
jgi:hypothetical protein